MKKIFGLFVAILTVFVVLDDGFAAKRQAAINLGTKVRGRTEATGVYNQDCYDAYYGCMDQFCIVDNEMGGSCNCNDDIKKYESALNDIKNMLVEAERISTEEVEKVQAGANADIIFKGTREYDKDGNVIANNATKKKDEIKKNMWSSFYEDEDEEEMDDDLLDAISGKSGNELYSAAHTLCKKQMDASCAKDLSLLTQMYSRQIASDCRGLANSIDQKKSEAKTALNEANRAVRSALKESLEESNKYDRGTCMVEYKKCMKSEDACGSDWGQCVFTIASENMQNNASTSVRGTKVSTIKTYDITPSTMEILESKRFICEKVLDSCVAVRNLIWDDFLREAAPTIRLAEQNIESKKRQSCLGDISDCIQKACKDDIVGKGEATMDACLARPDMARSFCKVQLDPCERMEPQIWDYVKSKLAAMRVDACTQEVKDCFTSEDRCGADFANCIGMDYNYIHDICPIDKLVVCKQANPDFKMSDLDSMLMGLYLNIDNKELEICENRAEEIMVENCGSTNDCNAFASDEYIGTASLSAQKDGSHHRLVGLISFGKIKMGDAMGTVKDNGKVLKPGEIGVQDYIKEITKKNKDIEGADVIIASISDELNNIAGTINRTISLLESDQRIQYCVNGRDLSQIKGTSRNARGKKVSEKTEARFPNLLSQYRTKIADAALRKAQDNYSKKWSELFTKASDGRDMDFKEYACNMLISSGASIGVEDEKPLVAPYSIVYDLGSGISSANLTGRGNSASRIGGASGGSSRNQTRDMVAGAVAGAVVGTATTGSVVGTVAGAAIGAGAASNKVSIPIPGGVKEMWSVFNRETSTCHVCTSVTSQKCKTSSGWFKDTTECEEAQYNENCQDIEM